MTHAAITLAVQLAGWALLGAWWPGAMVAAGYIGREHAQAEYRWIERFGGGKRANMPWWGGFDPKVWSFKSLTDWLLPVAVVGVFIWRM